MLSGLYIGAFAGAAILDVALVKPRSRRTMMVTADVAVATPSGPTTVRQTVPATVIYPLQCISDQGGSGIVIGLRSG